jgi:predicted NBD/HSP70 family sugar kinase
MYFPEESNSGLALVRPRILPRLDRHFRPAVLANRSFATHATVPVEVALERGAISRFATQVVAAGHPEARGNFRYIERWLKFLLWSRGACKVHFAGPPDAAEHLQHHYRDTTTGRFDAEIMGAKIYECPFEIIPCSARDLPAESETTAPLGKHWNGCRIGFDLGASDRKVAAVQDGRVVFSEEIPWDPRNESDPKWHFDQIMDALKRAGAHLPRVDGIGGSSAGVYVNNQVRVASLFRGVPEPLFQSRIKNLFLDLKKAWNGIPFEVVNDGEVTALAGAMSLSDTAVLGIAMGSSQAAGYVNPDGNITSWLNELAFVPIDYNPAAPLDEWSGDYGCGVQYFSQQAVGRLIPASGLKVQAAQGLPEKLVAVQEAMALGDERASAIYETIGTYLGYTIPHYADFYDFRNLLLLGRVTTGRGGEVIVRKAESILTEEFPELASRIKIHMPDEKEKRHGQAMAAASLPVIPSN